MTDGVFEERNPREEGVEAFFTFGEGSMLPSDRLKIVIQSSTGPFLIVRLTKHVIIEMYRIVTWNMKTSADLDTSFPNSFHIFPSSSLT